MPGMGSVSPVRGNEEQERVNALFKGGGAATDCVIQTTSHKVVKSLTYNAATGKFLLNLYDWPAVLVGVKVEMGCAAGSLPKRANVDIANASKTAYTVPVEFWTPATDVAAAALADPATTDYISVELVFQKSS